VFPYPSARGRQHPPPSLQEREIDKAVSITALEFIKDAKGAVKELFRVTRSKGLVVVATVNSQSPWAERRRKEAEMNETIFSKTIFRSPDRCSHSPRFRIVKTLSIFKKKLIRKLQLRLSGKADRRACRRALLWPSDGKNPGFFFESGIPIVYRAKRKASAMLIPWQISENAFRPKYALDPLSFFICLL